jgi:hypothetical protein
LRIALQLTAVAAICAAVAALAGPPVAVAHVAGEVACDVRLNVHDPDPKGMNVRAAPGKPPGAVIGVLKPDGDWTEVHAVAQSGDWLRIDGAETVDDDAPEGMRPVFKGAGWVHVSGLGISELMTGEGTMLRAAPSDSAKLLKKIGPDDEPKRTKILGCSGQFIHVDADGLDAWTRQYCTNERTTCS